MLLYPFVVVATCKTVGCGNVIAFAHKGRQVGPIQNPGNNSSEFLYQCGACRQVHKYSLIDARMEQVTHKPTAELVAK